MASPKSACIDCGVPRAALAKRCRPCSNRQRRNDALAKDSIKDRFFASFITEPNSGCWLWTASFRGTYPELNYYGRAVPAHQFSWELHNGPIPEGDGYHGTCVLHRCDTPPCVNPHHLFLGTQQANMVDCAKKGRHNKHAGEAHHKARLTADQVRKILASKGSSREVGNQYGVSKSTIKHIRSGRHWKCLQGSPT